MADRAHRLRGAASIAGAAGLAALLEKVESELQEKGVVPSLVEWREIWGKRVKFCPCGCCQKARTRPKRDRVQLPISTMHRRLHMVRVKT
ncbi:hypothetical protein ACFSHQ_04210 [Gemmobacter lanyuensis]